MSIIIDTDNAILRIEDIGVTLRSLLAYAAKGYQIKPKRTWRIVYKTVVIGSVRLKTNRSESCVEKNL